LLPTFSFRSLVVDILRVSCWGIPGIGGQVRYVRNKLRVGPRRILVYEVWQ
jgi:hypothetical protein